MANSVGTLIKNFCDIAASNGLKPDTGFGVVYKVDREDMSCTHVLKISSSDRIASFMRNTSHAALIIGLCELTRFGDLGGLDAYVRCLWGFGLIDDVDCVVALSGASPDIDSMIRNAQALLDSTDSPMSFIHFIGTTSQSKRTSRKSETIYGENVTERDLFRMTLANSGTRKAIWTGEYPNDIVRLRRKDETYSTRAILRYRFHQVFSNVLDAFLYVSSYYNNKLEHLTDEARSNIEQQIFSFISNGRYDEIFAEQHECVVVPKRIRQAYSLLFFVDSDDLVYDIKETCIDAEEKIVEYAKAFRAGIPYIDYINSHLYAFSHPIGDEPINHEQFDMMRTMIDNGELHPAIDHNDIIRFIKDYIYAIGYDSVLEAINNGIKADDLVYTESNE